MSLKNKCVRCLAALSVKTRFLIFQYLRKHHEGANIRELTHITLLKQPTISFHVNELAKTGLIKKTKEGREVYCKVAITCSDCPLI